MNKLIAVIILVIAILEGGCVTTGRAYNFVTSDEYGGGYVINRKGVIIPEYTIDRDNEAPQDLELAKKRFRRRKGVVDKYYKKMGIIVDSNIEMGKTMGGMFTMPFKMPFRVIDHHRYKNDPEYRKKIDEEEELAEKEERERINKLKQKLAEWIEKDLRREEGGKY